MLSIAKVGRGRQAYYLATVPTGRDHDYGLVEPDGRWSGTAAGMLGLAGVVDPVQLGRLLSGSDPSTGEVLSRSHRQVRVAAYDCTFSSPKSVSVLHALGPEPAVAAVREAHVAAVDEAFGYLERHTARVRRRVGDAGERRSLPAEGLAAAAFLHRSSRAPDPHLHTHLLVANCLPGPDRRWSALDAREMFVEAGTVSHCYEAQLRREIGTRLGLRFGPMRGCSAELEGFDRMLLSGFSRRSAEIAELLESRGWSGPRARRIAALATRLPKDLDVTYEALLDDWRERALGLGMAAGHLGRLVAGGRSRIEAGWSPAPRWEPAGGAPAVGAPAAGAPARVVGGAAPGPAVAPAVAPAALADVERLVGPAGLTRRAGSFSRGDVLRALCREATDGAAVREVEQRADAVLASPFVVSRREAVPWLRLGPGRSFPGPAAAERYTTTENLALERRLVEQALRAPAGLGVAPEARVAAAVAARRELGQLGASTVERLTTAGRGVEVAALTAGAGAGGGPVPSDAVEAAGAVWRSSGIDVAGIAPSLRSAQRWEALSGIETAPLDALGRDAVALRYAAGGLRAGVLVVGGADRIDPRRLCAILEGAGESGTKVVLVVEGAVHGPLAELAMAAGAGGPSPVEAGRSGPTWAAGSDPERSGPEPAEPAAPVGAGEWLAAGGIRVGVASSAEAVRRLASEECRRRKADGQDVILVTPDRATLRALSGDGIATTLPREAGVQLQTAPGAGLVVIGGAASLPSTIRRRAGIERTHVILHDATRGIEGRLAEAALPPRLVREIGVPPRSPEGRDAWRRAAGLTAERDRARSLTTETSLVDAVRQLDRQRGIARDRGIDPSIGGR